MSVSDTEDLKREYLTFLGKITRKHFGFSKKLLNLADKCSIYTYELFHIDDYQISYIGWMPKDEYKGIYTDLEMCQKLYYQCKKEDQKAIKWISKHTFKDGGINFGR